MELKCILNKISQTQSDKYCIFSHPQNLKKNKDMKVEKMRL